MFPLLSIRPNLLYALIPATTDLWQPSVPWQTPLRTLATRFLTCLMSFLREMARPLSALWWMSLTALPLTL